MADMTSTTLDGRASPVEDDDSGPMVAAVPPGPVVGPNGASSPVGRDRDAVAADMLTRLARESLAAGPVGEPARPAALTLAEAQVITELLDELAALYPDEQLGQLSSSLSGRLWQRMPC